jgi:methylated-DNA-protein-cysteine methyltransferase-like protein
MDDAYNVTNLLQIRSLLFLLCFIDSMHRCLSFQLLFSYSQLDARRGVFVCCASRFRGAHSIKHQHREYFSCRLSPLLLPCLPHAGLACSKGSARSRSTVSFDPVYKLVKQIPRGRVLTYGALAKALRLPGGARTAGRAMGATPQGKGIPWHRVLGANGKILIREPYASLQKKLLESEGIPVIESRINVKKHLWTPPRKTTSAAKKTRRSTARR